MAEFREPRLGLLAGGVEAADGAAAAAGALQHVGAEGPLVKLGPIQTRPLRFGSRNHRARREGRRRWRLLWGRLGDERAQRGVGGVGAMVRSEVKPRRRKEGDEAAHQRFGGEGEDRALLRRVLVPAVVETPESGLSHRAARTIPCQTFEPLPVVAMHGGVRVEREALQPREPTSAVVRSRCFDETQPIHPKRG